jgi:hypothetical protein
MAAGTYNFTIEQGTTFERTITINDSLDAPIDLTGFTFRGEIRKKYSDSVSQASFTFTILDQVANTGQVKMTMSSFVTASIPVDKADSAAKKLTQYCYDVEMDTGPTVERIIEGIVSVSPEVTRT